MLVTTNLTRSRDAPYISTLPPDVALFAVEKPIPLLQELEKTKINKICTKSFFYHSWVFPLWAALTVNILMILLWRM